MTKRMLIDGLHPEEARVIIIDDHRILDYDFVTAAKKQIKGNIYLGKITRVEPSLQAAFVEYGGNRQGFLPFAEIHPDYYQIPVSDRKRLLDEAMQEAADEEAEEMDESPRRRGRGSRGGQRENYELDDFMQGDQPAETSPVTDVAGEPVEATPSEVFDVEAARPAMPESEEHFPAAEDKDTPHEHHALENPPIIVHSEILPPVENADNNALNDAQPFDAPFATPAEGEQAGQPGSDGAGAPAEIETLSSEEDERRPKRRFFSRRYKIQEVIKRGQIVLVQVIKEERGTKGVSLSTYISLPGRYCVLMPNSPKAGGVSRKISSNEDRKRLRQIFAELKMAAGMSAIIRTAGMDRTRTEIKRDFDYLVKLWDSIREQTLSSTAPALIYEESNLIKRAIRDLYNSDIEDVQVEGDEAYRAAKDFMKMIMPSHAPRVKHYKSNIPLFYEYKVEDQLLLMHEPSVRLRSGGYIVLSPTEALISIDVNSGRSTGERNIEETATKTNLEAANEIARQIRLRDLAGLIVIDFIDMMDGRNRRSVERALKDALKQDRAKIQVGRISPFGLLEMSRQRLRPSISEASMTSCPHCQGRGMIRSNESLSIQIIRALEKEAGLGIYNELRLVTSQGVVQYLINRCREMLSDIEKQFSIRVTVVIDTTLTQAGAFRIEKMRSKQPSQDREGDEEKSGDDSRRERGRRGGRGRGRNRDRDYNRDPEQDQATEGENQEDAVSEDVQTAEDRTDESEPSFETVENTEGEDDNRGGRRRRRGRRGGRGRGRDRDRNREHYPEQDYAAAEGNDAAEPVETEDAPRTESEEGEGDDNRRSRRSRGGRGRGGRGRRKWRERNEGDGATHSNRSRNDDDIPTTYHHPEPPVDTREPAPRATREPQMASSGGSDVAVAEPQKPKGPARKGWWKRMVE